MTTIAKEVEQEVTESLKNSFKDAIKEQGLEEVVSEIGTSVIEAQRLSQELFVYIVALQDILFSKNIVTRDEMNAILKEAFEARNNAVKEHISKLNV